MLSFEALWSWCSWDIENLKLPPPSVYFWENDDVIISLGGHN